MNSRVSLVVSVVIILCMVADPLQAVFEIERCFKDLGCFQVTGAFFDPINRPFNILPNDPSTINTVFRLYTRKNKNDSQTLLTSEDFDFNSTNFQFGDETKIIIHGFREKEDDWMLELKDELLATDDMNIITVDWENGATIPYTLASSNTRVVGAQIALLIDRLQKKAGGRLSQFHLIGFSLGAHIAGYAGAKLKGEIRRITALDPAGPLFAGMTSEVRLDKNDARFVDVIHTDAKKLLQLSFGTKENFGHVDFYPNGGHDQPGCPQSTISKFGTITLDAIVKGLDEAGAAAGCRHSRSTKLYIDSIWGAFAVGYPCKNYELFAKGECATCGKDGALCGGMGSTAEQLAPINWQAGGVKLYLQTGDKKPYNRFHYQFIVKTPEDDSRAGKFGFYIYIKTVSFGKISATLKGEFGQSVTGELSSEAQVFEGGKEYKFLFTAKENLGEIQSLNLEFKPSSGFNNFVNLKWKVEEQLGVESVVLTDMYQLLKRRQTSNAVTFCSDAKVLTANVNSTYTKGDC